MSHFYSTVEGSAKTVATRGGTKDSGISGHIRGWNVGVRVFGWHDEKTGEDVFEVYSTGGSNNSLTKKLLGTVRGK